MNCSTYFSMERRTRKGLVRCSLAIVLPPQNHHLLTILLYEYVLLLVAPKPSTVHIFVLLLRYQVVRIEEFEATKRWWAIYCAPRMLYIVRTIV
jgi:hypothetical protein